MCKGKIVMLSFLPINMVLAFPLPIQIGYVALSLVLAVMGRSRKMGFWGHLFCSILFSPLIGLIVVLVSEKKRQGSA